MTKFFRYTGEPTGTRGDLGVDVRGGHTREDDDRYGDAIFAFDPDFGDQVMGFVGDPDWEEVSEEEYREL